MASQEQRIVHREGEGVLFRKVMTCNRTHPPPLFLLVYRLASDKSFLLRAYKGQASKLVVLIITYVGRSALKTRLSKKDLNHSGDGR